MADIEIGYRELEEIRNHDCRKCEAFSQCLHYQDELRIDLEDEFGSSEHVDCEYFDAVDGDIYLNPMFGDLWIVEGNSFIKINDGFTIDLDDPEGFVKVGHVDDVVTKKRDVP